MDNIPDPKTVVFVVLEHIPYIPISTDLSDSLSVERVRSGVLSNHATKQPSLLASKAPSLEASQPASLQA